MHFVMTRLEKVGLGSEWLCIWYLGFGSEFLRPLDEVSDGMECIAHM